MRHLVSDLNTCWKWCGPWLLSVLLIVAGVEMVAIVWIPDKPWMVTVEDTIFNQWRAFSRHHKMSGWWYGWKYKKNLVYYLPGHESTTRAQVACTVPIIAGTHTGILPAVDVMVTLHWTQAELDINYTDLRGAVCLARQHRGLNCQAGGYCFLIKCYIIPKLWSGICSEVTWPWNLTFFAQCLHSKVFSPFLEPAPTPSKILSLVNIFCFCLIA